jgi:serine/threonine protein kinase
VVTPYCGRDLPAALRAKPLDFVDRLQVFRDVVAGVAAAHEVGVTHRDLKPNNVVVDSHQRGSVIDFGICQQVGDELVLTTTDEAFGNAAFAAPECFLGAEDTIGPRADVYSLGKLLLWLVTNGRHLHRENLTESLVKAIAFDDPWVKAYVALLVHESVVARTFKDATETLAAVDQIYRGIDVHLPLSDSTHLVWDSMGPDGTGYPSGTRSATTPPQGNPPARYEVAQAFQFVDAAADGRLVELSMLVRRYHLSMRATIRVLAHGDAGPDENNVLWSGTPQIGDETLIFVRPEGGLPLQIGRTYWVCLSVDEPNTNLAWLSGWDGWRGTRRIFPGAGLHNLLAERADGQPWRVSEPSGAGMSLRVVAKLRD